MSTTTIIEGGSTPMSTYSLPRGEDTFADDGYDIPIFTDKLAERKWAKEQLAGAFRVFAKLGFNDGAGGHISLRDPLKKDCFWINPHAVHYGMVNASDMILIDEAGNALTRTRHKVNKAGFIIHAAIHKARPDVNVAVHTHSPYGRAWSAFGKPVQMLNQDCCYFYNDLAIYEAFGGVVHAFEEGEHIAAALGPAKKNLILQNHGILSCGGTVGEAAGFFIALERACQAQLLGEAAEANGCRKRLIDDADAAYTKEQAGTPSVMHRQFKPEYDLVLKETRGEFLT